MKVVFVVLGQEQLGISILSAVLRRAGHETSLVFDPVLFHDRYYFDIPILRDLFDRDDDTVARIVAEQPGVANFVAVVADLAGAALSRDRETLIYARLYGHHLRRLLPRMLRRTSASRVPPRAGPLPPVGALSGGATAGGPQ